MHQLKYLKIREKICEILGEFGLQVSTKEPRKLYMRVLETEIYDVLFTEVLYCTSAKVNLEVRESFICVISKKHFSLQVIS